MSKDSSLKNRVLCVHTSLNRNRKLLNASMFTIVLPAPGLYLYLQWKEIELRHYGDDMSKLVKLKILAKYIIKHSRFNIYSFLKCIFFIQISKIQLIEVNAQEIQKMFAPANSENVWISRQLSINRNILFNHFIKDPFDREFVDPESVICWSISELPRPKNQAIQIHKIASEKKMGKPRSIRIAKGLNQPTIEIEKLKGHVLGGRNVVVENEWIPDSPYASIERSLPCHGLVINAKGEVEIQLQLSQLPDDTPVAFAGCNTNYYHFMVEILPRILFGNDLLENKCKWILSENMPWQLIDIVKDVTKKDILLLNPLESRSFNHLSFVRDYRFSGQVDVMHEFKQNIFEDRAKDIYQVRNKLVETYLKDQNQAESLERIFLTRDLNQERVPKKIGNLEREMRKQGLEIINTAHMTVSTQVKLFSGAVEVFALGGASLTNLMFCRPRTRVKIFNLADASKRKFWIDYSRLFDLDVTVIDLSDQSNH